uniref:MPV17 mitochondrial inner membrane protein like 2 n=1 Tax=Poecilia formosa TaxID=48698 RepID=A0A087X3F3_POEFO
MLPRAGKEFLVRIRFSWRPLFQGRYLLLTNTLSGGLMLSLGDILQQTRENRREPGRVRDWKRTGKVLQLSTFCYPVINCIYLTAGASFATNDQTYANRLLCYCILGRLWLTLVWFCTGMDLLQGRSLSDGWAEFRGKFWEFYKMDWCVWPAAQAINFYFLSPKFRVVYINFVTLGWDTYLSYLKHRDESRQVDLASDSSSVDSQQEDLTSSKPLEEKA